jgi:membrane protein involved in colicin uptake
MNHPLCVIVSVISAVVLVGALLLGGFYAYIMYRTKGQGMIGL